MADARPWLMPAALGVLAVTGLRILLLAFNRTDLFVDEAQYWLWGQELAFGYYSKPPMIGWVIRAATELGSDAPFWIRLPAPLFHAATALILGAIGARLFGARVAVLVALGFVTLPMVAVGSLLISTDTIMFPFLAAALLGYLRLLDGGGRVTAVLTGVALGLAFLSKYAAVYYLICAGLAALIVPGSRLGWRSTGLLGLAFVLTISPNLIWNIANGLTTVQHTLDNADWVRDPSARAGLNLVGFAEFFGAQFAVFGPVLFATLLFAALRWRHLGNLYRRLLVFALPIVAVVCVQALLSRAYANWAAAAYLAGSLLVFSMLVERGALLIASFAVNGALCLIFPLASTVADSFKLGSHLALERYVGRSEMTKAILQASSAEGLGTIVASDRDVLADLFYTARTAEIGLFALPPQGRAPHHYALKFPYMPTEGEILLVLPSAKVPPCSSARQVKEIAPQWGAYRQHSQVLYRVSGACLTR